jgi:hypothetical protein
LFLDLQTRIAHHIRKKIYSIDSKLGELDPADG